MYKKGSVVVREFELVDRGAGREGERGRVDGDDVDDGPGSVGYEEQVVSKSQQEKVRKAKQKAKVVVLHCDVIKDEFWERRPWILSGKVGRLVKERDKGKGKEDKVMNRESLVE